MIFIKFIVFQFSFFVSFNLLSNVAKANDSFQFLEENKFLTAIKAEKNPLLVKELINKMDNKCPFKESGSELADLIPGAINLNISKKLSDAQRAECDNYLDNFNKSLEKTKGIQGMIDNASGSLSAEDKISFDNKLNSSIAATSSFNSLLQAQCEFDNSDKDISNIGNHLTNIVESGSSALYLVNPIAAVVGSGAAAVGRLASNLGEWLFGERKNKQAIEAKESEGFIDNLCSFRALAQKYDKLYSDPFENTTNKDKEIKAKKIARDRAIKESQVIKFCEEQFKTSTDALQAFSVELTAFSEMPSSQKQCLNLLNRYIDNSKTSPSSPLTLLALKYGCPTPESGAPPTYISYCKNIISIDSMTDGDIYDKCENVDFQKMVSGKFTNLSDILFRNAQKEITKITPGADQLQKIHENERNNQLIIAQYDALQVMVDSSPVTNVNLSKSITELGHNILGDRFDRFAKKSFKSAEESLEEATDALDDLVDQKNEIEGKGLFSSQESDKAVKAKKQKNICYGALQVKRQFANTYRSYGGVKDICDFMKGEGVPPLKSKGFNYDNYSASINDQDNNLSSRCVDIYEEVSLGFDEIKEQLKIISSLGCKI